MEDTSYSSNFANKEGCIYKDKSNPNFFGGYPTFEDSTSSKDSTSEDSFCSLLSPVQEPWVTESGRMPMGRREQTHDNSEELCELPIVRVLDVYLGSPYEDSPATVDLHGDNQAVDKNPQGRRNQSVWKLEGLMRYLNAYRENLKYDEDDDTVCSDSSLDEDFQSSTSASVYMDQESSQEQEDEWVFSKWRPSQNEDIIPFPDISPRQRQDELLEVISQETSTEDTLSVSSGQSTEGDTSSHSKTISCLNLRSMVRWFRKRVVSSRRRRKRPDTADKDPSLLDPKKPSFLRGQRIQPQ
ncbi:hypothetical protein SUZIE_116090 [Sciurus carolinensis]|uniref:Uncharacterized protein n=1 Tax=Sciurus carolinensis TaxID=30640 RepID=A0AA41MHJ3_SCICA|nr:hypothetical protein [Sciurus carolinensis]